MEDKEHVFSVVRGYMIPLFPLKDSHRIVIPKFRGLL